VAKERLQDEQCISISLAGFVPGASLTCPSTPLARYKDRSGVMIPAPESDSAPVGADGCRPVRGLAPGLIPQPQGHRLVAEAGDEVWRARRRCLDRFLAQGNGADQVLPVARNDEEFRIKCGEIAQAFRIIEVGARRHV
jgi:hypothetical protein